MNTAVGSGSTGGSGTKLVVGIDGSPGALHGAAWAVEAAAPDHLPILLVYALAPRPDTPSPSHPAEFTRQHQLEARARLSEAAEIARETVKGLTTRPGAGELRTEVRIGDAYTVLREAAADARLLVLGSKPPTLADASMVTTAALIAHCQCPVVVVKSGPPAGAQVLLRASCTTAFVGPSRP